MLVCILVTAAGVIGAAAQDLYDVETKPPRGFMPATDYITTPVDSIEPTTGKLHIEIPLASLPRGRAGSGFDLNLVYDSRGFDLLPQWLDPPYPYTERKIARELSDWSSGMWHYNLQNLNFEMEVRSDMANEPPCEGAIRAYRLRAGLLDGSQHVMHLKGFGEGQHDEYTGDGFYGIYPTGHTTPCAASEGWGGLLNQWLYYHTSDGSYLRLDIWANGSINWDTPWHLYFPDGRRMSGHGYFAEALFDANGNGTYVGSACHDWPTCDDVYLYASDDAGRQIRVDLNVTDATQWGDDYVDEVVAEGPNGPIKTTINWTWIHLGQDQRTYVWSEAEWDPTRPLNLVGPVVKYVQLPLETAVAVPGPIPPPVHNSYEFGYADDSNDGFGEVDYMRIPTGSVIQYRYYLEGQSQWTAETIASGNWVTERRVSHDGQPDLVWIHGPGLVTDPAGGTTQYIRMPPSNYVDPPVPNTWSGSLVYKIIKPDGSVIKRVWARNQIPGLVDPSVKIILENPYIRRETVTAGNAAGVPTLTAVTDRVMDKNGNLISETEYDWVPYDPNAPETGAVPRRTTTYSYYAVVPLATVKADDPEAYWNPFFSPAAPGQPRRLNAVRRKEVQDGAGTPAAITEFDYDDEFRAGNVEAELHWDSVKSPSPPGLGQLNASNSQVLTRDYDVYGNLTDIFEPEVRTRVTYDGSASVPTQVEYAYGTPDERTWSYSWHTASGTLTSKTDVDNNFTTTFTYDDVGRQTAVNEGGLRKTVTVYDDENRKVTVNKDLVAFGDGKLQATTEYDQLGRSILTIASEPGNPNGIRSKTIYNPIANRVVQSSAYRATSDPTLEWTCTQKDDSGRVTAIAIFKSATEPTDCESASNRTGITRMAYDTNWTQVTDPAGKVRVESRDALGRLVKVIEDPGDPMAGKLDYHTDYAYDTLGNLTQVSQGVQTRTFVYSSLGRLLSASNPESGNTTYAYTDSGDLLTRTDARGVAATFTYDNMHRIKTKTYTNDPQLTPTVTYDYYTTGSPKAGQLQSVVSSAATTELTSYDVLGRVTGSTHTVSGYTSPQSFAYTYWLSDTVKSVQYPSGRIVNYDVDDAGRTVKVRDAATTFADLTGLASSAAFTAGGRIRAVKLGNELWETRDYQTPGTPTKYRVGTTNGGAEMLELEYNFSAAANNGNLLSHVIRNPGRTWSQSYSYDALNRIQCAGEAVSAPSDPCTQGDWRQVFGMDRYGNRWVEASVGLTGTDVHEPTVSTNFDPNTNRLYIQGSQYDAAGNQTFYTPFALAYDAENRMVTMTGGASGNGTFTYDGDGRRVKKSWTVGGTMTTTYYFRDALGQLALEYSSELSANPGRIYVHTDMLGSTRMVTSDKPANWPASTASVLECYDYAPFGRLINSGDPSAGTNQRNTGCYQPNQDYEISSRLPQKFTGKERDPETRLDFFGARYYSAAQGRFTAVDPLMASAKTSVPQTWNRYTYGLNNPLRFVDPTGMYICDGTDKECDDFDDTLKRILKSKDKNALRAAQAYGVRGKDNGVTVGFADKLRDRAGEVIAGPLGFANDRFTATMRVLIQRDNIKNEETIAHEGSHVADRQDFVSTIRANGDMTDALNITQRESEIRAYQLSVQYALTGNKQLNFGPCGVDECKFTSSQAPVTRDRLINQLLDDPRNPYTGMNLNRVLYPELLKPQQK